MEYDIASTIESWKRDLNMQKADAFALAEP